MAKTLRIKTGLKIEYVQVFDRELSMIIGNPVKRALGIKIKKELFADNPNIVLLPSMAPKKK